MWQPSYGSLKAEHVGYVWTGKFDLNTDTCVDVEIFESEKKKFQIQKYPDTCGQRCSLYIRQLLRE